MKHLLIFALFQTLSAQAAPLANDSAIMDALEKLGVQESGMKAVAMASITMDDQGNFTERLGVFFDHILGSQTLTARDVSVYATDKSSFLVMTFASDQGKDFISERTQIFPVETDDTRLIANYVRAHSDPVDNSSSPTLKINAYKVKYLSCGRVVYPDAETTCSSN